MDKIKVNFALREELVDVFGIGINRLHRIIKMRQAGTNVKAEDLRLWCAPSRTIRSFDYEANPQVASLDTDFVVPEEEEEDDEE